MTNSLELAIILCMTWRDINRDRKWIEVFDAAEHRTGKCKGCNYPHAEARIYRAEGEDQEYVRVICDSCGTERQRYKRRRTDPS